MSASEEDFCVHGIYPRACFTCGINENPNKIRNHTIIKCTACNNTGIAHRHDNIFECMTCKGGKIYYQDNCRIQVERTGNKQVNVHVECENVEFSFDVDSAWLLQRIRQLDFT